MPFKTWNRQGTAALIHRADVLNAAADCFGMKGVNMASGMIDGEYVSAVQANVVLEACAKAFA